MMNTTPPPLSLSLSLSHFSPLAFVQKQKCLQIVYLTFLSPNIAGYLYIMLWNLCEEIGQR